MRQIISAALPFKSEDLSVAILWLGCLLPFLVPFSLERNITLQGLILGQLGVVAWLGITLSRQLRPQRLARTLIGGLGLYGLAAICSLVVHPSAANLYGAPLLRLGSLGLVACIGCGLLLRRLPTMQIVWAIYVASVLLAAIAVPYTLATSHQLLRVGGIFHQPDLLAVWTACGIILGIDLWHQSKRWRWAVGVCQALLVLILLLSQTRAVLLILTILVVVMVATQRQTQGKRLVLAAVVLSIVGLGVMLTQPLLSHRLSDVSAANESVTYRLSLQSYAVRAATKEPLWGYGAGSLSDALACPTLHTSVLQTTCQEGYYFDSSHNIFLDRFLALGWIGGLAFVYLVAYLLISGFRTVASSERSCLYCALLISLYYCTNVTSVSIELLLWIFLLRPIVASKLTEKDNQVKADDAATQ